MRISDSRKETFNKLPTEKFPMENASPEVIGKFITEYLKKNCTTVKKEGDNMSISEKSAIKNIEKHGCTFIAMIGECGRALWTNKYGYKFIDDIFVLNTMGDSSWEFWANYNPE